MVGIANILALSKLTSDTPDKVRQAATLMIVGGDKNPLISGIAHANIVEEATSAAVQTTTANKAKAQAETKVKKLEADIDTIRPLINAVAEKTTVLPKTLSAEGIQTDHFTQMVAALRGGTQVETVLDSMTPTSVDVEITDEDTADIPTLVKAAKTIKSAIDSDLTGRRKRKAGLIIEQMLGLPASELNGIENAAALKDAIKRNA